MTGSSILPPPWMPEFDAFLQDRSLAEVSLQSPLFKKPHTGHVIMDIPDNPLIDEARFDNIVETMARAMIEMHENHIIITDRAFFLYGFTMHQVYYCQMDAAALAMPHITETGE